MIRRDGESSRLAKVSSEIRRCLASEINDLGRSNGLGMASITRVTVSSDMRRATIYVSFYSTTDDSEKFFEMANLNSYLFQKRLGSKLRLKRTPNLCFVCDEVFSKEERIDRLLKSN